MARKKAKPSNSKPPQTHVRQNQAGNKPNGGQQAGKTVRAQPPPIPPAAENEAEDDSQEPSSPPGPRERIAKIFSPLIRFLSRKPRAKTMPLDADEYDRRIQIVTKRRSWTNDQGQSFLDTTAKFLLEKLDDKQAPPEYRSALTQCMTRCTTARDKYASLAGTTSNVSRQVGVPSGSFFNYRAEVVAALAELIDAFTAQRDALALQGSASPETQTAPSITEQNGFLSTEFQKEKQAVSDPAQASTPAIDAVRRAGDSASSAQPRPAAEANHGAGRSCDASVPAPADGRTGNAAPPVAQPEDWQGRYEEISGLYTKSQQLLAETQQKLQEVNRALADEQRFAEQRHKEAIDQAVADKVAAERQAAQDKEEAGKKQHRIVDLMANVKTLHDEKQLLEIQLKDLAAIIQMVQGQAETAKSAEKALQIELDKQNLPEKARAALETQADALPQTLREFVAGLLKVADNAHDLSWLENNLTSVFRFVYTAPEAVGLLAQRDLEDNRPVYQVITLMDDTAKRLRQAGLVPIYPKPEDRFDSSLHEHSDRDIVWTNNRPDLDNKIEAPLRVGFKIESSGKVLRKCVVRRYVYRGSAEGSASATPATHSTRTPPEEAKAHSLETVTPPAATTGPAVLAATDTGPFGAQDAAATAPTDAPAGQTAQTAPEIPAPKEQLQEEQPREREAQNAARQETQAAPAISEEPSAFETAVPPDNVTSISNGAALTGIRAPDGEPPTAPEKMPASPYVFGAALRRAASSSPIRRSDEELAAAPEQSEERPSSLKASPVTPVQPPVHAEAPPAAPATATEMTLEEAAMSDYIG